VVYFSIEMWLPFYLIYTYLFALQQELDTYDHLQKKIEECDKEIEKMLDEIINSDDNKRQHHIAPKPHKRINKNTPKNIDLNLKSYQMFEGTDLLASRA
jgi:transposase